MSIILDNNFLYFLIFQFFLNLYLFLNLKKIARRVNIFDIPNERKIHKNKVPLLGGFFLFLNIVFLFLFDFLFIKKIFYFEFHLYDNKLVFIFLVTILIIFILGLLDDKYDISYEKKLIVLVSILFLNISIDEALKIDNLNFSFIDSELILYSQATIFSILCFLIYLNSVNMFDGINLQTSLSFLVIYIFFILNDINLYFSLFIILYLLFFSFKNLKGKVFMGDSGSLLISYVTAFLIVKNYNILSENSFEYSDYAVSFMILPILDLSRQFVSRIMKGQNPFHPDKNHLHHRLYKKYHYKKSIIIILLLFSFPIVGNSIFNFRFNFYLIVLSVIIYFNLIYITSNRKIKKGS